VKVDIAGNYWKPRTAIVDTSEMPLTVDFDSTTTLGSQLYCTNNLYVGINFLNASQLQNMGGNALLFSNTSLLNSASTVTFHSPQFAYDTVLARAGALHPQRDSTDMRVLSSVLDSTEGLVDCIYSTPILLDSGGVMSGTDSSIIYSQLLVNPAISAEGRKVAIVSGTGVGQARTGMHMNVIDTALRIVEAIVDTNWTIIPDSTSIYEVIVTCDNYIGSYPNYAQGTAPIDTDHDGMPDNWETSHGLNPLDSADRNGNDLDSLGYTNLEVYLNEFYQPNSVNAIAEENLQEAIHIFPNPAHDKLFIEGNIKVSEVRIIDLAGRVVDSKPKYQGEIDITQLYAGLYIVEILRNDEAIIRSRFIKE
jgi:hypothetical protein